MAILVTGGAGYIGSHTCLELLLSGYEVVVADDLSNSSEEALRRVEKLAGKKLKFYEIDVNSDELVQRIFVENKIDAVIHFAAFKAVGESVEKPLMYYANNVGSTLCLLKAMAKYGCKNFVFSSSATVYGEPDETPILENFPIRSTSPYAETKIIIEHILRDVCAKTDGMNVAILRYFNPIGAHESGEIGENPRGIPNNLMPYITQVATGALPHLNVYGNDYDTPDGTGIRDYIHVVDLARGHVAALNKLDGGCGYVVYNIGTGIGSTVIEVIKAFEQASGVKIPYKIVGRRAGDVKVLLADPTLAERELGWRAQYSLLDMCRDTYNWLCKNPQGY